MFRSRFWSSTITSDEGFSVKLLSREYLRYIEGVFCVEAAYDAMNGQANLVAALLSCETGRKVEIAPKERTRILGNIVRALESRGFRVTLV